MNEDGTKYDVIVATDLIELVPKVQAALNAGWICHGGLAASSRYLYQVMIMEKYSRPYLEIVTKDHKMMAKWNKKSGGRWKRKS